MGMYTCFRFKGIIKNQYREEIGKIEEYWEESWQTENHKSFWEKVAEKIDFLKDFSKLERSSFIPFGAVSAYNEDKYMSDNFKKYNLETGEWEFLCDLKNYGDEIETFIELIPQLCDDVSICEEWYEEWKQPRAYKMIDNKMIIFQKEIWEDYM